MGRRGMPRDDVIAMGRRHRLGTSPRWSRELEFLEGKGARECPDLTVSVKVLFPFDSRHLQ